MGWSILDEEEFSQARYWLGNSWAGKEGKELRGSRKADGLWEGLQAQLLGEAAMAWTTSSQHLLQRRTSWGPWTVSI